MAESYAMNGGDDDYSYTKNSSIQRKAIDDAKRLIAETITHNLNIKDFHFPSSSSFNIVDLGCSVGPNTFTCVENIIEPVKYKFQSEGHHPSKIPECQVLFSDHVLNDFNALFRGLPPEREYFCASVPGSFHGRLFPKSSLHFVHTSNALNWLSQVPKEIQDNTSPAWNKGRISYIDASSDEVRKAYATQFAEDMDKFLDARAKELVIGGIIVIIMPGIPDEFPHSCRFPNSAFHVLGSTLVDMAQEGLVNEAQVDSFNMPIFIPSSKEMIQAVERSRCFNIERIELLQTTEVLDVIKTGNVWKMAVRASCEGIISKHFGSEIIDELFDRFFKKTQEYFSSLQANAVDFSQIFLALKRV